MVKGFKPSSDSLWAYIERARERGEVGELKGSSIILSHYKKLMECGIA